MNIFSDNSQFTLSSVNNFTPRTQYACKSSGVVAQELVVRPFEAFAEGGVSAEVQKMRYSEYEQTRQETIASVKQQRRQQMAAAAAASPHRKDLSPTYPDMPTKSLHTKSSPSILTKSKAPTNQKQFSFSPTHINSTTNHASPNHLNPNLTSPNHESLLQAAQAQEQERINKALEKANKDLERVIESEMMAASKEQEQIRKVKAREEREREELKKKKAQELEIIRKRDEWEALQIQVQEEELLKREKLNKKKLEMEKQFQAERDAEEKKRSERRAQKQKEMFKRRMDMERKKELELETTNGLANETQAEMARRERAREAMIQRNLQQQQQMLMEKAQAQQERINMAMEQKQFAEQQRVMEIQRKQMEKEEKRMIILSDQAKSEKEKKKLRKQHLDKWVEYRQQKEAEEARKIRDMANKTKAMEQAIAKTKQEKAEALAVEAERKRLNRQKKEQNQKRLERIEQFKTQELMEHILATKSNVEQLEKLKRNAVVERQRNQLKLAQQKQQLMGLFTKMKKSATWGNLPKLDLMDKIKSSTSMTLEDHQHAKKKVEKKEKAADKKLRASVG